MSNLIDTGVSAGSEAIGVDLLAISNSIEMVLGFNPISGISAIISNGFDLSCWNTSYTPQDVSKMIKEKNNPYVTKLLTAISTSQNAMELQVNLNIYSKDIHNNFKFYSDLVSGFNWSSCSKKALTLFISYYKKLIDNLAQLETQLNQHYKFSATMENGKTIFPQGGVYWSNQSSFDDKDYQWKKYSVAYQSSSSSSSTFSSSTNQNKGGSSLLPLGLLSLLLF